MWACVEREHVAFELGIWHVDTWIHNDELRDLAVQTVHSATSTSPKARRYQPQGQWGPGYAATQGASGAHAHERSIPYRRNSFSAAVRKLWSSGQLVCDNLAAEAAQFISDRRVSPTDCATVCTAQTMLNQNMLLHCRENLN